jgi:hypothetical protein
VGDLPGVHGRLRARTASVAGVGSPPFGEPFWGQAGVQEGVHEAGHGKVSGAGLGPDAAGGPGHLGPVAVRVAGADHHGGGVAPVGEPSAEARVDADVYETPARLQDPGPPRSARRGRRVCRCAP